MELNERILFYCVLTTVLKGKLFMLTLQTYNSFKQDTLTREKILF
jgi:hypothetical protein